MKYKKSAFKALLTVVTLLAVLACSACREEEKYLTGINRVTYQATTDRRDDRVTIYTYVTEDDESLAYDNNTKFYYPLLEMSHMYNNYCSSMKNGSDSVYLVKFPSRESMIQQMSTEIMAGSGPDIIILDNQLPIRKLMDKGAFEDLNSYIENDKSEKALNLADYDERLLNAGVYKGKRYMMPMLIEPDVYVTKNNLLKSAGLKKTTRLTFDNLVGKLGNFTRTMPNTSLFDSYESSLDFVYRYIGDNINFDNNTVSFNSEKFRKNIELIRDMVQNSMKKGTYNNISDDACLFDKGYLDSEGMYNINNYNYSLMWVNARLDSYSDMSVYGEEQTQSTLTASALKGEDTSTVFINGLTKSSKDNRAFVSCGFMINANSKMKEKAYAFIRYAMGERMQRYITDDGANFNIPVNKKSLEEIMQNSDNKEIKRYEENLQNLNTYTVEDGYYNQNVIADLVQDYLGGKISTDNFIENLMSKTVIYLNE